MKRETLWKRLLEQSRHLTSLDARRPGEANLRRAVSGTYYALFHLIVHESTVAWFGSGPDRRPLRDIIGRAYTHTQMKEACRSFSGGMLKQHLLDRLPGGFAVPPEVQSIAQLFVDLQQARHSADYDLSPVASLRRADVRLLIDDTEEAIENWHSAPHGLCQQFFLATMVTWDQIKNRS
jgi:hypothetical protein